MNMVNSNGDMIVGMPEITIGAPVTYKHIIAGEITSAEVKGDCVEAVMELNDTGKQIFKEFNK